jgi:acetyl esterase/lipase
VHPLLSPALCADGMRFPPLLPQVRINELLLDESTQLAERARDAEPVVILDVTADLPHVWSSIEVAFDFVPPPRLRSIEPRRCDGSVASRGGRSAERRCQTLSLWLRQDELLCGRGCLIDLPPGSVRRAIRVK